MNRNEIARLVELDGRCGYHEANKKEYKRLSLKLLRTLSRALGLERCDVDIRFNPGGIAVSGDATLHTDRLYVTLNMDGMGLGVLARTCKHRRDYAGGPNNWFSLERLRTTGLDGLAAFAQSIHSAALSTEETRHGGTAA